MKYRQSNAYVKIKVIGWYCDVGLRDRNYFRTAFRV
jgi:hypothetical protein